MNSQLQQTQSNNYIFRYFAIATFIIGLYMVSGYYAAIFAILATTLYLLFSYERGLVFWCACSYFVYLQSTGLFAVGVAICLGISIMRLLAKSTKVSSKVFGVICLTVFIGIGSYYFGVKPELISMAMTFCNILIYLVLVSVFNKEDDLAKMIESLWVQAYMFIGITMISLAKEGFRFSDRLGFEDNVRSLSNAIAVALFFWIVGILSKEYGCKIKKWVQNFLGILGVVLLLLTLSKGVIFALALAILAYCLLSGKGGIKLVLLFLVIVILGIWMQSSGVIDFSRLGERNYDLNGRTRIWEFYFEKLRNKGLTGYLFGLGPGNIKRVAVGEYLGKYYVHSTILDFFYSYGVLGISTFVIFILGLVKKAFSYRDYRSVALIVLLLASYFVNGASTNTQIFLSLALVNISIAKLRIVDFATVSEGAI